MKILQERIIENGNAKVNSGHSIAAVAKIIAGP